MRCGRAKAWTFGAYMDNQDQSDYWNGDAGARWVSFAKRLDAMLMPFAESLIGAANIGSQEDVLDIGCGGGALSLMASKMGHSVLGVDISQPLIDLAWERSKMAQFVQFTRTDASSFTLAKKRNVAISLFGVMFFADPVAAFSNIRQQLKPDGRMIFACWQSPTKNGWARAPLEAAMPFFKEAPSAPDPRAPGPFAFADSEYLTDVLMDAGWAAVELKDWTKTILLPGRDVEDTASFMMEMGPLSKIIKAQDLDFGDVQAALVDKLSERVNADGRVEMPASVWIVKASKI